MNLPIELYYKLITYGIYEPPHYIAYKTGIRVITSCELNCKLSGTIKLEGGGYEENDLNEEWFLFLLSQEYNI
tara:strand:+ start:936 stop:1154 length:219 start_codon:yes stop_codon:yes gene_type:complete